MMRRWRRTASAASRWPKWMGRRCRPGCPFARARSFVARARTGCVDALPHHLERRPRSHLRRTRSDEGQSQLSACASRRSSPPPWSTASIWRRHQVFFLANDASSWRTVSKWGDRSRPEPPRRRPGARAASCAQMLQEPVAQTVSGVSSRDQPRHAMTKFGRRSSRRRRDGVSVVKGQSAILGRAAEMRSGRFSRSGTRPVPRRRGAQLELSA